MIVVRDIRFNRQLFGILKYIAQDKKAAAIKFEKELNNKIDNLVYFPLKCRASIYCSDEKYRDMVYQGYTIIYKVEHNKILLLDIFKWQNK